MAMEVYDSKITSTFLDEEKIKAVIKTRKNSSTKARGSPSRTKTVREMERLGYEAWRDKYRHGKR
ncbi:hypothetical protein FHEFKHOI_01483 [Candidatus Methanoperedenaceae archaeon GB50]|nr:MAG: hypothetical protein KBONHNOK_00242 [Candidatus Methanoperedenaceae archaeon GB50]CAD7773858.1 hypothetical protein AIOGIFDO_01479 [Candidatus Methanoperedenaceae archaeon GB37]CAD7773976.1 hypothetical protein FHEFKHOI_01483 [Candidatus Methanoperedenaceae archaeon GB50]